MKDNQGFLLIDKPEGLSSFKVVQAVRRNTIQKRVGHAGTLDPFATGLLILALGRTYTRQIDFFQNAVKKYVATFVLGQTTDTLDIDGQIIETQPPSELITKASVEKILPQFLGKQLQEPPQFSAKKVNGKRAYKLARAGKPVELKPTAIEVFHLQMTDWIDGDYPKVTIEIECSKGTYVRSLGRDIGKSLGTVAYTSTLRRTQIGGFNVSDALDYKDLSPQSIDQYIFTSVQ